MGFVRRTSSIAGIIAAIGFASCTVEDTLDDRLWPCDESLDDAEQCGTKNGRDMVCWQGYCMESCDPEEKPSGTGDDCLPSGVLLQGCHPSQNDCPGKLSCNRTSLLEDRGVCVPFPVCTTKDDCEGRKRSRCAGDLLREMLGANADRAYTDHFQCVQDRCSSGSECNPDETCLDASYGVDGRFPDICIPKCDGKGACPPNYACAQSPAAPGADPVCLPGLPGVRCTNDRECVVGTCLDTGAGFSVCTVECSIDADCKLFNAPPTYFLCAGVPGEPKHCVTPSPFGGVQCDPKEDGADCPETAPRCYDYSPATLFEEKSQCRVPCDADHPCPARGGLPHVCLANGAGGCHPGGFGLPCNDSDECIGALRCEEVVPDGREVAPSPRICTHSCVTAEDCDALPETGGSAYCDGFCRVPGMLDAPCERAEHCRSTHCMLIGETGVCVE